MTDKKNFFRPRARLLVQLGDQLIRSENIAIIELIKNSYDADAKNCEITCEYVDDAKKGQITIQDDGVGMTPDVVENVWLEPGADFKAQILEKGAQASFDFEMILPKRTPIGEKGVGRFGAHKLGSKIELTTKSALSAKEVVITIDWDEFSEKKYLEDATFDVQERDPVLFKSGKTGTRIVISGLRYLWTQKTYQELTRNINSLKSPFEEQDDFVIKQELILGDKKEKRKWQTSKIEPDDIRTAALWEVQCSIQGKKIVSFDMYFKPWTTLNLEPRHITLDDLKKMGIDELSVALNDTSETSVDLDKAKIGKIDFHAYMFDLDSTTLRFSPVMDLVSLRKYLSENGGARVYRDNFRVYDYGEPGNDWLGLDKERINNPSKQIGNRNLLAAVMLNRKTSRELIEKTNREGFVENQSYKVFLSAIQYVVNLAGIQRLHDKTEIRTGQKNDKESVSKPINDEISTLKDTVVNRLLSVEMKNRDVFLQDISEGFDKIQEQYSKTSEILIKSSNMGLTFGVVVHEVDKRLDRVKRILEASDEDIDLDDLRTLVNGIVQLVEGYGAVSATDKRVNSVKKTIDIALLNTEFRFKAHGIDLVNNYEDIADVKAKFSLNSVVGILLNLFDNSIYWLNKSKVAQPKVFITTKRYDDSVGIIVADNGTGFSIDFEDAIKPFYTQKVIGGHGLGLHIASEVMKAQNGNFVQRSASDIPGLPDEFKNGAIVELIFKA